MESNFSIIGFLISLVPLFLIIFVFRWIRFIYQNSEKQVEQNEKIIELLMEIKDKKNRKMAIRLGVNFTNQNHPKNQLHKIELAKA